MRIRGPGIAKAKLFPLESRERVLEVLEDVGALIDQAPRTPRPDLTAFRWGDATLGGAGWIQPDPDGRPEALRVCWNQNQIDRIDLEPRPNISFFGLGDAADPVALAEAVIPMLWRHIRNGGKLPPGIERFADALSLSNSVR